MAGGLESGRLYSPDPWPPLAGRAPPTRSDWQHGGSRRLPQKERSRAARRAAGRPRPGGIGAPVTEASTYLHAGHLIIWVNLSAALRATALLPESAGRLVISSQRAVPTRAGAQSEGPQ